MSFPECVEHAYKQIKYFFDIAINQRQKYVIGTEFTFIQSLLTERRVHKYDPSLDDNQCEQWKVLPHRDQ